MTFLSKSFNRRILDTCFRCLIFLLIVYTRLIELLKKLVGQRLNRNTIEVPIRFSVVRKLRINIIRKLTVDVARQISLTVRDELRDMIIGRRETIAGKSVAIIREVFLRKSDETILS
jgi:hypothetical protein